MVQAFVITLREGIEAALIVGLMVSFLQKSGNGNLVRSVLWGLLTALLASLVGAHFFQRMPINEELYEGIVYLTAAFFLMTMVIWVARHAARFKQEIEQKVDTLTTGSAASWQAQLGIFLFSFMMIFREGIETVLFLSALLLSEKNVAFSMAGGVLGLGLATLFGILFAKGSLRIPLKPFFQTTSLLLFLIATQLTLLGFHELFEAGVFPGGEREMALIGPIVRNQTLFWMLFIALPLLLFLIKGKAKEIPALASLGASKRRQVLAEQQRTRRTKLSLLLLAIPLFVGLFYSFVSSTPQKGPDPNPTKPSGTWIRVPTESVSDGKLHTFNYTAKEQTIRFLILKTGRDHYATALDACIICGPKGYAQAGESIICIHCTAEIFPPTIGQPGGCNPIPVPSKVAEGSIWIRTTDLAKAGEHVFKTTASIH